MNATTRFALRLLALLAASAAILAVSSYRAWGSDALLVSAWAVGMSFALGLLGYSSLGKAIRATSSTDVTKHLLGGMALRVIVFLGGHFIIATFISHSELQRFIFSAAGFYALALGLEVLTVQGELARAGRLANTAGSVPTDPVEG